MHSRYAPDCWNDLTILCEEGPNGTVIPPDNQFWTYVNCTTCPDRSVKVIYRLIWSFSLSIFVWLCSNTLVLDPLATAVPWLTAIAIVVSVRDKFFVYFKLSRESKVATVVMPLWIGCLVVDILYSLSFARVYGASCTWMRLCSILEIHKFVLVSIDVDKAELLPRLCPSTTRRSQHFPLPELRSYIKSSTEWGHVGRRSHIDL